uniref:Histone H1.8 n=1 Tax=Chlorocebus sabaeus TaxID=60711 RepID=A0A0D9RGQ7_CHLSB
SPPGSVTSSISPSTSIAGSSRPPESEKPDLSCSSFPGAASYSLTASPPPGSPTPHRVVEALQVGEQRWGTSAVAIKLYILHKYPTLDVHRFKYLLKQALATGMCRSLLTRPLNSKARGATGSFKLDSKHKRKIQPRKMAPMVPRRAGEAKGKGPKKPSEAKEYPPNAGKVKKAAKRPAEVQRAPPKPGAATEKAHKQGGTAKDTRPQPGKARKAPPPDKATQAPSSASRLSRKAKAKGSRSSRGDAEDHRKTKAGSRSSKPTLSKVKNGAASSTRRWQAKAKAPKGAGQGPNAKSASPAKDSGSKVVPAHLSRKTETPKGPGKAGLPITVSSSEVSSQRAVS